VLVDIKILRKDSIFRAGLYHVEEGVESHEPMQFIPIIMSKESRYNFKEIRSMKVVIKLVYFLIREQNSIY